MAIHLSVLLLLLALLAGNSASLACSLTLTSPIDGATVHVDSVSVSGTADATGHVGQQGAVTAYANGILFYSYGPGILTSNQILFASDAATAPLIPGENHISVEGYLGSCTASDAITVYYQTYYLDSREEEGAPGRECEGNPCDPATGGKTQVEVDVELPHGLRFVRHYDSRSDTRHAGSVGRHWRHNFHSRINHVFCQEAVKARHVGRYWMQRRQPQRLVTNSVTYIFVLGVITQYQRR